MSLIIKYHLEDVKNESLGGQTDVFFDFEHNLAGVTSGFICSFYGPFAHERAEKYIAGNPR